MERTGFSILEDCVMRRFDEEVIAKCAPFTCGNTDLDEFFMNDSSKYADEMLGKTYCWITTEKPHRIVGLVTLSNDSIKSRGLINKERNKLQRHISNSKRGRSYPAVLIGRLGVNVDYQNNQAGVGTQIMLFLKMWFRHEDNKTGCRFIVVDAYNDSRTLHYYSKNGFEFLYASENEERRYYDIAESEALRTRMMYFDLKRG